MSSYVQMRCAENSGPLEEEDISNSMPIPESSNFISPTIHIRAFPGSGAGLPKTWVHLGNRWKLHTALERRLMVLTVILILILLVSIPLLVFAYYKVEIRLYSVAHNKTTSLPVITGKEYCTTAPCVQAAASIISAADFTADPCQDFFQYSCGQWIHNNPIPESKSIWGTFDILWQQNQITMKNILEQSPGNLSSGAERKAQMYYQSCLDVNETMEALGAKPMLDLLQQIGGWAAINSSFRISSWDLQKTVEIAHNRFNMGGFFTWAVAEDDKNSSKHVIQMDQGGLTLPNRDYYVNKTDSDEVLAACLDFMTKVGILLGAPDANATRKHMKDILTFESRLAEITIPSSERRDEEKLYHAMKIKDLSNLAPFVNWLSYFNSAFSQVNITVTNEQPLVVYAPDFLKNLSSIVTEYLATDTGKTVLHNYLAWHTVRAYVSCLSKAFRDASKILRKVLVGTEGTEETWRYCVTDTNNVVGFAIGAMFVRQNFHGESKPIAEKMIANVKEAFKKNFDQLDWMDAETRKAAREKADAISDMIGFPEFILNAKDLDSYYEDLEIRANDYFNNNARSNQFVLRQNLAKLNEPVNRTIWGMTPSTVNAYYTPNKNQIVFPAGILQKPFFDTNFPPALNYGAMGVVMGHELTHAFDDQGREFDKDGDLAPWWNNATVDRFQTRTSCLVDQYSSYSLYGQALNGKQTLGENIADNGGLKAAFHAYEEMRKKDPVLDFNLPGVNLTHQQLFFLAFAQVWCSSSTKEALRLQILNDPHSAAKYRVIGPLSNLMEFSQAYQCPKGSAMNPAKKCEIW